MPRNISFALTMDQFKDRSKTVTRRLGWNNLKAGDILNGVEKVMGFKKGEKVKRLGQIKVTKVTSEPLHHIRDYPDDCVKEGFPKMKPMEFVAMFRKAMNCNATTKVTRIEFEYLD